MKRYALTTRENCMGASVGSLAPDKDGDWVRYEEVQGLEKKLEEAELQIQRIQESDDGYNGPTWCGTCGAPMQVVRPGKHQCTWCEEREALREMLEKTAKVLRENGEGLATTIEKHLAISEHKEEAHGS